MGVYFLRFSLEAGGGGGNFVAKHDAKPPASIPKQSLILFYFFFFQPYVTLSFHSSTIYADFWFKIILIGICSRLSAFYHTLTCMLWFNFIPGLIFFPLLYITILQNKGI